MKILCTGLNYLSHIRETGREPPVEPLLFGKFENTLIGPGAAIVLPPEATHVDSEAELAVEIGRAGRQCHTHPTSRAYIPSARINRSRLNRPRIASNTSFAPS